MGIRVLTEADTCTKFVLPRLQQAGWDNEPHSFSEQLTFTDGRIVLAGARVKRKPKKRLDYLLRYTRDFPIAVVEAKSIYETPGAGLQQAKQYAEILGLSFAYATNGHGIVEFDYLRGTEHELSAFPSPDELWTRLQKHCRLNDSAAKTLLEPNNPQPGKTPRYYQQIAINRTIQTLLQGQQRILLTMATGTGKTVVAFQICWKLSQARWNRTGEHRRPRILYLADRNILIDDPKDKTFAAFAEARWKIENGLANKGREMYFAIYQAIAQDEMRPGLYREYSPDFFDLIIVDECHRGSANDEGKWREILEYFQPAFQLGMTATPKRLDNIDTYRYFGDPIYTYSLRQGIEDGFLAPYRVHRIVTTWDAVGWRPSQGDLDRFGRAIPDEEYRTNDFERIVSLRKRTEAIARHLTNHLRATDRMAKTIVFCVDQEHADDMRRALVNLNSDLVKQFPDYVARVTSDEADIGRGHLSNFQDIERPSPVILTTSQLLTTGVDAPTCKNIVLARAINSMVEFKQIIGRGTRVKEESGKLYFSILDYTGSATRLFADPDFDGDPVQVTEVTVDDQGEETAPEVTVGPGETEDTGDTDPTLLVYPPPPGRRKFYFDGGHVEIAAHLVYELDADGKQLRVVKITDYAGEKVRTLYTSADELRGKWSDPQQRQLVIDQLEDRGISFDELAISSGHPDADPFDLLCHIAFNAPLRTRKDRADRLRKDKKDFFAQYTPQAREILDKLLTKYTDHGTAQFALPDVLQVPPINAFGNVMEIATLFGVAEQLRVAVNTLQANLYAA
ncbi:MAG: DEAD/DEAH box helicase family protein [Tepidisphaeraceae bacterium]|jgi:type I restriction enzyme R subunit